MSTPAKKPDPIFVDAGGNTFRFDPPASLTGYVRIMLMTENQFNDQGEFVSPGQRVEIWVDLKAGKHISDALAYACNIDLQTMMGTNNGTPP